jgi:predicted phage tail protein
MNKPLKISGEKGGKGGSGGSPNIVSDNLLADSTAYIIDVVSEGEIEGWANPDMPGTCILFDDTPLQNDDGSYNFEGVNYWLRTGTADQEPVPGFSSVESEVHVGVKVEQATPIARTINDTSIDACRVKVGVSALLRSTTEGDRLEASVEFAIEVQADGSGWQEVHRGEITGKTTSGYQRAIRLDLPDVRPVSIRVVRITDDSESELLQNDLYFVTLTEIVDAKLSYPNTAYVALSVPAEAFGGRAPRRSYKIKGIKCMVPSNYDGEARTYSAGIWDGTFKTEFTRNPMWFLYEAFQSNRWGLGDRVEPGFFDKWAAYEIAKYCDELVPDGRGGMEPRFSMDGAMSTKEVAYQWITRLSSIWRGVTYWGAGAIVPVQDAPKDPVLLVTNSNIKDGKFSYSGTARNARYTTAVVSFRDATDHFKIKPLISYDDPAAIERYGRRETSITLPFCTSLGEALRAAKWAVETNTTQKETVTYVAGLDHLGVRPGDVVLVQDKFRTLKRLGGRIASISLDRLSITLDAPSYLSSAESHQLQVMGINGELASIDLPSVADGANETFALDVEVPSEVEPGAVFILRASGLEPKEYRIVSNVPKSGVHSVSAIEEDKNKFDRVEYGLDLDEEDAFILPSIGVLLAPASVAIEPYYRADPGSVSKQRFLLSWEPVVSPLIASYRIEIKEPGGTWYRLPDTKEVSADFQPVGSTPGVYMARVSAINIVGASSQFVNAEVDVTGLYPVPAAPSIWGGIPGFDSITLTGQASTDPDFKAFVIYGATSADVELMRLDEISTTLYTRRVENSDPITRYAVSALNHSGLESPVTAFVTVSPIPPGLEDVDPEIGLGIDLALSSAQEAAVEALAASDAADDVLEALDLAAASLGASITEIEDAAAAAIRFSAVAGSDGALLELIAAGGVSVARIDAANILLKGSVSAEMLTVGSGSNMIDNSNFMQGLQGIQTFQTGLVAAGGTLSVRQPSVGTWVGKVFPVLQVNAIADVEVSGYIGARFRPQSPDGVFAIGYPVAPSSFLQFTMRQSIHRADVTTQLAWYDVDGVWISNSVLDYFTDTNDMGESTEPSGWTLRGGIAQAPATAHYAAPFTIISGTTHEWTAHVFGSEPMLCLKESLDDPLTPYQSSGVTVIDGGNIVANSITTSALDTVSLGVAGLAVFGGGIQSTNYVAGVSGWIITQSGYAQFNDLLVTGDMIVEGAVSRRDKYAMPVGGISIGATDTVISEVSFLDLDPYVYTRRAEPMADNPLEVMISCEVLPPIVNPIADTPAGFVSFKVQARTTGGSWVSMTTSLDRDHSWVKGSSRFAFHALMTDRNVSVSEATNYDEFRVVAKVVTSTSYPATSAIVQNISISFDQRNS